MRLALMRLALTGLSACARAPSPGAGAGGPTL